MRAERRSWLVAMLLAALVVGCSGDGGEPGEVASEVASEPVRASVQVDRAVATTGDVIEYSIELDYAEGVEVTIPETGSEIAGFRIVDLGEDPARTEGNRVARRFWYQLRADLVGSYILPSVSLDYEMPSGERGAIETSEIFVEVESVLPEDGAATDIRDVKKLRRVTEEPPWLWIGLGAVLLALAAAYWWWRRRRAEGPKPAPSKPAHDVAFEALARLRQTDFDDLRALRRYYFEISEVLRTYVEARFGLNATDLTTEEILPRLSGLVEGEQQDLLRRFLVETDGVKYAARVPGTEQIESTYESALRFVEVTARSADEPSQDDAKEVA